ncbi:DUF2793 domain-containing protein [Methylobacterium sp. Leaf112]|uniref:DUF2793 domain-containing protein n=1 Tax=Methylobacterium sp. Leaf112 TaxID=1736258 RepID=UPI0006FC5AC6|nr:DUF2793 domain-containing protein [Methylobacterium sp. Leaf112]KQP60885.1 hypothetical protein ASF52_07090 [Methylobacterium sp. Leaf112]
MAQTTPHLALPLLAAGQAGKHVTHNEALLALDALVHLACRDRDLSAPPTDPAEGDRYLVTAPQPSGAWAGLSGQIAAFGDGVWTGLVPRTGWLAYVADEDAFYRFDGTGWRRLLDGLRALSGLAALGLGTEADAANPFAAKLDRALWTARDPAEGGSGSLALVLNKATEANAVALLFQAAYAGRAEFGLLGEDAVSLKVSPDGAAWHGAWRADPATGHLGLGTLALPGAPAARAPLHVAREGAGPGLCLEAYGAAPVAPLIETRTGRGSREAPLPVRAGDCLLGLAGGGVFAGGVAENRLTVRGVAEEDFSAGAQGTGIVFEATDLGGTVPRAVVKVRANGALELVARAGIPGAGTAPGQIVFDSTLGAFRGCTGAAWSRLTGLARFRVTTSFDNYIGAGAWTRIGFNTGDLNDQGLFQAATGAFVAPEAGVYALSAGLAFRRNGTNAPASLQGRFHRNGTAVAGTRRGAAAPVDGVSTVGLGVTLALAAGDTITVHALFTGADGYVAASDSDFSGFGLA